MGELNQAAKDTKIAEPGSPKKGDFHLPGMKQKSGSLRDKKVGGKNDGLTNL
jgi:hypothetical protein